MGFLGGLVSGLGSAVGGLFDYFGAQQTANSARDVAAQQVQSTREQMQFQERMSNTAYQRGVADMKSAGLNPMLAYTQGGASSPGGASVGSLPVPTSPLGSLGTPIVSSARDSIRLMQEIRESNSRIRSNLSTARTSDFTAENLWYKNELSKVDLRMLKKQDEMMETEAQAVREHPGWFGYLKALSDRGLAATSALGLLR